MIFKLNEQISKKSEENKKAAAAAAAATLICRFYCTIEINSRFCFDLLYQSVANCISFLFFFFESCLFVHVFMLLRLVLFCSLSSMQFHFILQLIFKQFFYYSIRL